MDTQIDIARFPGEENIFRLITNTEKSGDFEGIMQRETLVDKTMLRAREYLLQVLHGDGRKPHCPFVRQIEDDNGYFVFTNEEHPKNIDLPEVVGRLRREFNEISPRKTFEGQPLDPTTVVAAFGHERAMSRRFYGELQNARNQFRLAFLQQGLMLAHMHPFHPLGSSKGPEKGDKELYVSGIPLLTVRRMHKPDHVFMHTAGEKAAYAQYFGA